MNARLDWIVREAANNWIEQTERDREVLRQVQRRTIEECVHRLQQEGYEHAAAELERLM